MILFCRLRTIYLYHLLYTTIVYNIFFKNEYGFYFMKQYNDDQRVLDCRNLLHQTYYVT